MSVAIANKPRILRGAFVEYGLSVPPLKVNFQFNPEQLTRNRSISFDAPGSGKPANDDKKTGSLGKDLRKEHLKHDDLSAVRDHQLAQVREETISFDIRLDATDQLNEGDEIAGQFGIAPQLATLELMVLPKGEGFIGQQLRLIDADAFSFTAGEKPPMILFVWGRRRVLPVNIDTMNITESAFGPDLTPIRATVAVGLTVIDGKNTFSVSSRAVKETLATIYLANSALTVDVAIPG